MAALDKLNELGEKMLKMRKRLANEGKKTFMEACLEIFEIFPKLESFSWKQYTPYFSDGDACVFGVRDDVLVKWNGLTCGYDEHNDGDDRQPHLQRRWSEGRYIDNEHFNEEASRVYAAAHKLVLWLCHNESVALDAFGDHAEVTVTRDGVEVDCYDHD